MYCNEVKEQIWRNEILYGEQRMCTGGRGQKDESIGQQKKRVGPTNWQMGLDVNYCFLQYLITLRRSHWYGVKTTLHTQYIYIFPPPHVSIYYKSTALQNEVQNLYIYKKVDIMSLSPSILNSYPSCFFPLLLVLSSF